MDFYKTLHKMLIKHEGVRLKPYKDTVGKWTIGVGRNLDDKGISKSESDFISPGAALHDTLNSIKHNGISEQAALFLLNNDIRESEEQLKSHLSFYSLLPDVRKIVLINMCFNMGIAKLLDFKKTLHYIESGNYESASQEMLNSKWAQQVHHRANELSDMIRDNIIPASYL